LYYLLALLNTIHDIQAKIPILAKDIEPIRKMRREAAKRVPKTKHFLDDASEENDEEAEETMASKNSEDEVINAEISLVGQFIHERYVFPSNSSSENMQAPLEWALQGDQALPKTAEIEPIPRVAILAGMHQRISRGIAPYDDHRNAISISPASSPLKTKSVFTPSSSRYGNGPNEPVVLTKSAITTNRSKSAVSVKKQVVSGPIRTAAGSAKGGVRSKSAGTDKKYSGSTRPGTFTHMPTMKSIYAAENKHYNASKSSSDMRRFAENSNSRSLFEKESAQPVKINPLEDDIVDLVDPMNDSTLGDLFDQ
jgi:hypothetical protein